MLSRLRLNKQGEDYGDDLRRLFTSAQRQPYPGYECV